MRSDGRDAGRRDVRRSTTAGAPRSFTEILDARLSRRGFLGAGAGATAAAFVGPLAGLGTGGCGDDGGGDAGGALPFRAVRANRGAAVTVPDGYRAQVLFAFGDPIAPGVPAFRNDGTDDPETYAERAGTGHDGLRFFPLPDPTADSSDRGLLVTNHENVFILGALHEAGPPTFGDGNSRPVQGEVIREMAAHGVSIVEIRRDGDPDAPWSVVQDGAANRRITPMTPMDLTGPVRGSDQVVTQHSPDGTRTRGTLNNCAIGFTPWGTYLTCEENWHIYFKTDEGDDAPREKTRYGVGSATAYGWETAGDDDRFTRFDTTPTGGTAADDFRNEANGFGWVVEIDPYDPASTPVKRTALGRFKHEGCWPAPARAGQPVVFYSGDDERNEYIYKFVSAGTYEPGVTDGTILDDGTLFVARFDDDGTGEWLPLTTDVPALADAFDDLADLLVNTRTAADLVGATPMDRPEWGAVNPANGEVYMSLTNNSERDAADTDAANPRPDNPHGHIIRWREDGDDPTATSFAWDVFLFGHGPENAPENLSELDRTNAFASPDGLWFDDRVDRGVLWIQTDDSSLREFTNNQLLAAVPGQVGDGARTTVGGQETIVGAPLGQDRLRRFLVGPEGCEITGIDMTPDGRTMFINVQHPGGEIPFGLGSPLFNNWPADSRDATADPPPVDGVARPRPATIAITRDDGEPIV